MSEQVSQTWGVQRINTAKGVPMHKLILTGISRFSKPVSFLLTPYQIKILGLK